MQLFIKIICNCIIYVQYSEFAVNSIPHIVNKFRFADFQSANCNADAN